MPSGLDGNCNPVITPTRTAVLAVAAKQILAIQRPRVLIAVDGRSGAGKSTFADELTDRILEAGRQVVRSTTDSFHRPRLERMRLGPTSAEGYFQDSHQLEVIRTELLEPFTLGANEILVAAFDEPSDTAMAETAQVDGPAILIFDGLFLQRAELNDLWDLVVYLDADRRIDQDWLRYLTNGLPEDPTARAEEIDTRLSRARWPRYRYGWRAYLDAEHPADRADLVIDNNDLAEPLVVTAS